MRSKPSLRDYKDSQNRRKFLQKELDIKLDNIANSNFNEDQITGRNIENLIGAIQIPLGVAGPLKIRSSVILRESSTEGSLTNVSPTSVGDSSLVAQNDKIERTYYIPLATTEGALVASISRGCKAVTESDGATVYIENVGITRGPVFKTKNLTESIKLKQWIENNFKLLSSACQTTSSHLKLLKIDCNPLGRNLFARFYFDTTDAMGMNMATFATEAAVKLIEQKTEVTCISLAGNFDIDKKPAWLNFINGRGKKVWAEVILKKETVESILKTTPEKISDLVYRKCQLGSIMSGSLGFNAHFANIIAAVFAATGQDLAHVVEGSLGVTTAEVLENNDLQFSIYLPSLEIGTVGGGSNLPAQKEALEIMQVSNVLEYGWVLGGTVLAGELSLLASLAEGSLAKAHKKLGRKEE